MDSRRSYFAINGKKSTDYGIVLTVPPAWVIPERDVTVISVPGRSGDLVLDNGRFLNAAQVYECLLIPPAGQTMRQAVQEAMGFLHSAVYARIEDSFDTDHYRLGRTSGTVAVESIMERGGAFTITYDCKPQRFRKSGEAAITVRYSGSLENPTQQTASPLIKVLRTGACVVGINGKTVQIKAGTTDLYLDCESQNAYRLEAGVPISENSNILAPEFPVLQPGDNAVTLTGNVSRVEITPRWWDL